MCVLGTPVLLGVGSPAPSAQDPIRLGHGPHGHRPSKPLGVFSLVSGTFIPFLPQILTTKASGTGEATEGTGVELGFLSGGFPPSPRARSALFASRSHEGTQHAPAAALLRGSMEARPAAGRPVT